MIVQVRHSDGVTFLDLEGELKGGRELSETVSTELSLGHRAFIVNLARVTHIDHFGMWGLSAAKLEVSNYGGTLVLLNITLPSDNHVQMAEEIKRFAVFEDERYAKQNLRRTLT